MKVLHFRTKRIGRFGALFLLIIAILLCGVITAEGAWAYTTDSFDVDVTVNEDNSYEVTETVNVNYDSPRHGIYRYIPMNDMDGNTAMKIDRMWVDGWNYETYDESGCRVLKIGSGDVTVTGRQTFQYGYRIRMYDDMDTSTDLFYLDLLPTDWETAIKETDITVTFPKPIDKSCIILYNKHMRLLAHNMLCLRRTVLCQ